MPAGRGAEAAGKACRGDKGAPEGTEACPERRERAAEAAQAAGERWGILLTRTTAEEAWGLGEKGRVGAEGAPRASPPLAPPRTATAWVGGLAAKTTGLGLQQPAPCHQRAGTEEKVQVKLARRRKEHSRPRRPSVAAFYRRLGLPVAAAGESVSAQMSRVSPECSGSSRAKWTPRGEARRPSYLGVHKVWNIEPRDGRQQEDVSLFECSLFPR